MVDKAVDATWKVKPASINRVPSKGARMSLNVEKENESFRGRVLITLMAFIMAIVTFFRSLVTKQLPQPLTSQPQIEGNAAKEEEENDLLNSVMKKLSELEEKIGMLQSKPSEMPYEKAELLNAAVCRVDALEAELIATKKALYEALMRQEELLAYIDHQEIAQYQKKKKRKQMFCF